RVPGEARRAARLRVADGALRIGRRRRREEDAGDDEDERRQPEREDRGDTERVVDGRPDVAVGGGEQGGCPENPVQVLLAPTASHCLTLRRRPSGPRQGVGAPPQDRLKAHYAASGGAGFRTSVSAGARDRSQTSSFSVKPPWPLAGAGTTMRSKCSTS